jgi:beta-lactamase superfamily II metal-dependent hydrolase
MEVSMKRLSPVVALFALSLTMSGPTAAQNNPAQSGNLRIYWIDVEGGASTLFVSPTGESLLFDTGYPDNDRDAKRILAAAQKAGLKQIDHVVISHWHGDHVGGLPGLAKLIPIGKFYDHGDGVEQADQQRRDSYKAIAGAKRTIVKAGDTIPLGGVQVRVVVSEGPVIANPINGGGPNPLCTNTPQMTPAAPENIRMVGLAINYGNFKMATLGDLDWSRELELVCPINKLGTVNVYTINRHGGLDDSGSPALLGAIKPQVVVINNGPRKGLGQSDDRVKPINAAQATPYEKNSYLRLAKLPGIEGIWQEHLSMIDSDPAHNTSRDMIANLEDRDVAHTGNWIMASIGRDGKFTITNSRTGFSKTYTAR